MSSIPVIVVSVAVLPGVSQSEWFVTPLWLLEGFGVSKHSETCFLGVA
jgi:hypothetical protein